MSPMTEQTHQERLDAIRARAREDSTMTADLKRRNLARKIAKASDSDLTTMIRAYESLGKQRAS